MGNIITPVLPHDLPENWNDTQYVSPGGTEVGLTEKHGYNYLMKQVNNSQKAINELDAELEDIDTTLQNKAPAGYGLGTTPKKITDWNDAKLDGWYCSDIGALNSPDSNMYFFGIVYNANNPEVFVQEVWHFPNVDKVYHWQRFYYPVVGNGTPWEWIDPPMYEGVVYRTTERHLGNPVYKKMDSNGVIWWSTDQSTWKREAERVGAASKSEFDEVKAKVMDTSTTNVNVFLTGAELPGYIASLPKMVNDTIMIYVSGTITQNVDFQGFYGNGALWIRRNGDSNFKASNVQISFSDCSARIYFYDCDFSDAGAADSTYYKGVVQIFNCRSLFIGSCTFTGNGTGRAIFCTNNSIINISSCTITNFGEALAPWGGSIMYVNHGVSGSNNSKGFHMYGASIAVLHTSINKLLGGASNYRDGGVIIQNNAFV